MRGPRILALQPMPMSPPERSRLETTRRRDVRVRLVAAVLLLGSACSPLTPFRTDGGVDGGSAGGQGGGASGGTSAGGAGGGATAGGVASAGGAGGGLVGGGSAGGTSGGVAGGGSGGGQACPCTPPGNATAVCADGGCDFTCNPGLHRCGDHCAADDSVNECGASCATCPSNGGAARCTQGQCDVTCAPGFAKCQGQCVAESNTQCGASCVTCQAPAMCRLGACLQDCPVGQVLVAGACLEGSAIELGILHGCARHDGGVVCWGTGVSTGALGSGMDAGRHPQWVSGIGEVSNLSLGDNFSCATLLSGSVRCWGDNQFGQLGNGGSNNAYSQQVTLASGALSVAAGSRHACALLDDAGVVCWGTNILGQHGTGGTALAVRAPEPMRLDGGVQAIFAGDEATWTVQSERGLRLTGDVPYYGVGAMVPTPVPFSDGGVRFITNGASHGCLIRPTRALECWGRGFEGQLGRTVGVISAQPLAPVPSLGGVADVCTGQYFTCALILDGGVRCFGAGANGQLGGGNFNPSSTPVEVLGLPAATQLACRYQTVCALTSQGVYCWGDNAQGQLGVPTPMTSAMPLPVPMP